jgi:photosystem II stability/assembly factor-like uncharacterized protein
MAGTQSSAGARIFKTTDGGNFWRETYLDTVRFNEEPKYVPDYYPVECKSFNTGLVIVINQNGSIIRSVDFGETWVKYNTLDSLDIGSFTMLDEKRAVLTSENWGGATINGLFYSDDSCKTFKKYIIPDSLIIHRVYSEISISKNNDIYTSTSKSSLNPDLTKREKLKMNFEGSNWQLLTLPRYIIDLYFFNNDIGVGWGNYIDKNQLPDTAVIYKTYNGGKDWELKFKSGNPYKSIREIKFWDDSTGYCFGKKNLFLKTTDQGESWYFIKKDFYKIDAATAPMSIEVTSKDIVYLMYGWSEMIYKYCPLTTSVEEPVVSEYKLYPNPLKLGSSFQLSFNAIKYGNATIYISDIEGKELVKLFNNHIDIGTKSFTFNVPDNISSGVYWLVIEMNGYCHVKMLNIID